MTATIHDDHMEDYDAQIHDGHKPWRPQQWFLPARRYASAGNSDRNVSVRPSVRPSPPVLCQNEES